MIGVILVSLATLFVPGGILSDNVDQSDFPDAVKVLADNATASHATTLLIIVGILLYAYGVLPLFAAVRNSAGEVNHSLRMGLLGIMFSWGIYIVQMGARHVVVHIETHGIGTSNDADISLAVHAVGAALYFAFLSLSSLSSILLGIGLAARTGSVARTGAINIYQLAAYGFVVVGLLLLITIAAVEHFHDLSYNLLVLISGSVLVLGALCYFVIGLGMYRGRPEIVPTDGSA